MPSAGVGFLWESARGHMLETFLWDYAPYRISPRGNPPPTELSNIVKAKIFKLAQTHVPDRIRPTRWGLDPNQLRGC